MINLAEGHYLDIQLIDANGCTSATGNNITLSEPIDFTVTYAPVSVDICDNATATFGLAVTGATPTYVWQQFDGNLWTTVAGATSNTFTSDPLQDTTAYQIVATSAAGCRYTSPEANAYVHPVPEATLSATASSCPGTADGSVDLTMVTTAIPMTYLWNTGATTEDLTNVESGTYTVNLLVGWHLTAVGGVVGHERVTRRPDRTAAGAVTTQLLAKGWLLLQAAVARDATSHGHDGLLGLEENIAKA